MIICELIVHLLVLVQNKKISKCCGNSCPAIEVLDESPCVANSLFRFRLDRQGLLELWKFFTSFSMEKSVGQTDLQQ